MSEYLFGHAALSIELLCTLWISIEMPEAARMLN